VSKVVMANPDLLTVTTLKGATLLHTSSLTIEYHGLSDSLLGSGKIRPIPYMPAHCVPRLSMDPRLNQSKHRPSFIVGGCLRVAGIVKPERIGRSAVRHGRAPRQPEAAVRFFVFSTKGMLAAIEVRSQTGC
jgi:hypothetical protein